MSEDDVDQLIAENHALEKKLALAKGALESCIAGSHMWVVTPESATHCKKSFDYIRDTAREALEKLK